MRKALFLVGPTASGKSSLALLLAKKLKGEIVSCDSMQVYRGMDIGTDKPSAKEQKQVRHHLINLSSPRSEFSVFEHRQLALKAMETIFSRGKLPIVIGGSGLYVKALVEGISPQPGGHSGLRRRFREIARRNGVRHLYSKLQAVDPIRAAKIHPNDQKRIIRALEILSASGRSQADWERKTKGLVSAGIEPILFGLERDRKELYERVERRVDRMFDRGWVSEVKRLKKTGLSKTAREAIGYREILEHLKGMRDLFDAQAEIKKRTRHLVKKQLTWFRKTGGIHWIRVRGNRFAEKATRVISKEMRRRERFEHAA